MLASPTVGWNWVPVSFVFHCSDKILPLFLWCSNPRRALVAVPAALLRFLAIAISLAADLFHLGLAASSLPLHQSSDSTGLPNQENPRRQPPYPSPFDEASAGPPQGSPAPEVAWRQLLCRPPLEVAMLPQPPDLSPVLAHQDAPHLLLRCQFVGSTGLSVLPLLSRFISAFP
jgi:hypothetical protein